MQSSQISQILDHYHENRLSHAFLIETNSQETCLKDIKKLQICRYNN